MNNRQKNKSPFYSSETARNKINFLLVLALFSIFGLACNLDTNVTDNTAVDARQQIDAVGELGKKPRRLESYSVRGFKFSYYLIPKNLTQDELIITAQKIRQEEPDAQLILVDDDSRVAEYAAYAKDVSMGDADAKMPREWANEHIVANVQKYLSGKWMLCEKNGYKEIAELK